MSGTRVASGKVVAVLLADGWHQVIRGSFSVGALDFGAQANPGALGFRFEEADNGTAYAPATLAGPLGSILAIRQVDSAARDHGELASPGAGHWARPTREAVA